MNEVSESNQVGDEVLLPVTRNPREPAQISLVTWNLNLWKHEDQELESNVEDVLGLLTELEPDFVGFQEVFGEEWNHNLQNLTDSLTSSLSSTYLSYFGEAQNKNYGNAAITNKKTLSFENFVVAVGNTEKRACLRITIQHPASLNQIEGDTTKSERLSIYVLHLHHIDEATRVAQLRKILTDFVDKDEDHFILGDFNSLKRSDYTLEYFEDLADKLRKSEAREIAFDVTDIMEKEEGYVDVWRMNNAATDDRSATCKWGCRIDYIWASQELFRKLDVDNSFCLILEKKISDHFPVCAGFSFR